MPTDPVGPRDRRRDPGPATPTPLSAPWWQRLGDAKVTPGLVLLFFLGLAVLSATAAGINYVAHHVRASVSRPR